MDTRRARRDLKAYYGMENGDTAGGDNEPVHTNVQSTDPCNLDGANFKPETYLSKLIQVIFFFLQRHIWIILFKYEILNHDVSIRYAPNDSCLHKPHCCSEIHT